MLGARMLHGKNILWEYLCENTWKQKSYGRYVAEFPDFAVLGWSVHSCLLRDSRRVCHLLCVLMGQMYKRMSLLSKKLTFLREGGWMQISVRWNLEIHMWAENASHQPSGVQRPLYRGVEGQDHWVFQSGYQSVYRLESRAGYSSFGGHWGSQQNVSGSWIGE